MNIRTVAQYAQVSTATVSRVMNGSARVNPETAERVRRAIEATNFYPNTIARSLGSGRSGLFGLIISDITNPFFPGLVKAFEGFALEGGQEVVVGNTDYDPRRLHDCVARFLQRKVEGVAIMTSEVDDSALAGFNRRQIPLVFLDSEYIQPHICTVKLDYAAGMELAFAHLAELGHRRIGFISGPLQLKSAALRYAAFLEIRERRNLGSGPALMEEADHRVEGGHNAMKRLLRRGERPTAMMTSNDLTAIGVISAIQASGLRVPQDISVIGFDDIPFSAYTSPPLTTVAVDRTEIARAAFAALLREKERPSKAGAHPVKVQVVQPTLVVRSSTSAPDSTQQS